MEEPVLFIEHIDGEHGGSFAVTDEAAELLSEIEGDIAVISIAGVYRTGKSFVLNQLAGSTVGFDIGSSVEPCTQGIWMWIVDRKKVDKGLIPDNLTVILLDTEGLASYTKTKTYDIQVFSIALLLSSFFVYNSMGNIDESALDRLSLVAELAKFIKLQANGDQDGYQLQAFFPAFLWLVRDFSLELMVQGEAITTDDYLEQALQPVKGDPKRVGGKNQIRECIKNFFPNRSCFTLKRPVEDEQQLQNLAHTSISDFRPEYLEQVRTLIKKIYHGVKPKKLFGNTLNGVMLLELARNYITAINDGGVPTIRSAWENVLEIECKKAMAAAEKIYNKRIKDGVEEGAILEEEELEKVHRDAEKRALDTFRAKAVGGPHVALEDQLKEFTNEVYKTLCHTNRLRSEEECELLLDNLSKHISDEIRTKEIDSIDKLHEEWESIIKEYLESAKGPLKNQVLFNRRAEFFSTARRVADGLIESTKANAEKELEEARNKSKVDYQRLDTVYKTVDGEWKRAQKENQQLVSEIKDLDLKVREMGKAQALSLEKIKELEKQLTEVSSRAEKVEHERDELEEKEKQIEEELQQKSKTIGALETEKVAIESRLRDLEAKKKKKKGCVVM